MLKLFKFLRPYAGSVAAIFCVLMVQAYCDLSLPAYTSDIVNVGIQQKGIDEKVPYVISEEDLNRLLLFVPMERQETVREAYETSSGSSEIYVYDRDASEESGSEGNVLEISKEIREDGEKLDELSEILGKPMLLCAGFDSGSESAAEMERRMKEQMESGMPDVSRMSVYEIFEMMEGSQRDSVVAEIEEQFSAMPETMIEQSAAIYIQNAYGPKWEISL